MPAKVIGDIGYVFRKKFGDQGWFMGTAVKIKKDGDRRCKYSDMVMSRTYCRMILYSLPGWTQTLVIALTRKRYILSKNLCRMSNVDQLQQRRRRRRRRRGRNASLKGVTIVLRRGESVSQSHMAQQRSEQCGGMCQRSYKGGSLYHPWRSKEEEEAI